MSHGHLCSVNSYSQTTRRADVQPTGDKQAHAPALGGPGEVGGDSQGGPTSRIMLMWVRRGL